MNSKSNTRDDQLSEERLLLIKLWVPTPAPSGRSAEAKTGCNRQFVEEAPGAPTVKRSCFIRDPRHAK